MASETYNVIDNVNVGLVGDPLRRYEARSKVVGSARYAADEALAGTLHAALVTSSFAKGRITGIDATAAEEVPGFRGVLTHENVSKHPEIKPFAAGGVAQSSFQPLAGPKVRYAGQIVGMVVAESIEAARHAASLVDVTIEEAGPAVASIHARNASSPSPVPEEAFEPPFVGDVDAALETASASAGGTYRSPVQHHSPIELYATSAEWRDGMLTAYVPSQWVTGTRSGLATAFGLPASKVRVISSVVGGGFGSKATLLNHVFVVCEAARRLGAPVKLYVSRDEMFTVGSFRPATTQELRVGGENGRLTALDHTQDGQTSEIDLFFLPGTEQTSRMYDWQAVRTAERTVATDTNTPGFMRAPAETMTMFALESAVDELAWEMNVDPVELRLASDSDREPIEGLPWSSRSLTECLVRGRDAFGWSDRPAGTRATRRGSWLHGYGTACAIYPAYTSPAQCDLRVGSDLSAYVAAAAHDLGTGTYTVCQQIVARELGLPPSSVRVGLGDSDFPSNAVAGGSRQTGSLGSAVLDAARQVRSRLIQIAIASGGPLEGASDTEIAFADGMMTAGGRSVELGRVIETVAFGSIQVRGTWTPDPVGPKSVRELYRSGSAGQIGFVTQNYARGAFGAHFVEVAVDTLTGEVRVPRTVSAFAAGRIVNERTARSQLMGGVIWGISSALHEATEVDHRHARFVNTDLGEYYMPVNADVPSVSIELVEEIDEHVNPLGAKGIGELGLVGVAAGVANAVYHATGKRLRELPIRMEHLIET